MDWVIASTLMFISSICLYLLVRKSTLLQTPTEFNNLAMMFLPVIYYLLIALYQRADFSITWYEFVIIFFSAIFFSYLGNLMSLKSIEIAPNPGYSLIISKSYVLLTTILSIFLFDSVITIRSATAIVLIIAFSALIVIDAPQTDTKRLNKRWFVLSLGAFFCWGFLALTSKYLLIIGMEIIQRLVYSMSISTIFVGFEIASKRKSFQRISVPQAVVLLLIGVAATAFNYYMQVGFDLAPNIGFVNSINSASIAGVSFFSFFIFGDELTVRKFAGILGVIVGLVLLII